MSDSGLLGYFAIGSSYLSANGAVSTRNIIGFLAQDAATLYAANGKTSYHTDSGVFATQNAMIYAEGCTAQNNTTGYFASWNGLVAALSTNANNAGNTTNYSPATSGTPGNFDGLTRWS